MNPWLPALLSLIVPGSGQFILRQRTRGVALLLTVVILLGLILWTRAYALLAPALAQSMKT